MDAQSGRQKEVNVEIIKDSKRYSLEGSPSM
jgi:hypothetical protein